MVEISDELLCLFHANVEERQDSYVVEVPKGELTNGVVEQDATYRVALFPAPGTDSDEPTSEQPADNQTASDQSEETQSHAEEYETDERGPPVAEGDERTVDIEAIGEQGDGIARVDRGYVVIVPDTEQGERVTIEITDVNATVGFGDVVSRAAYYE